MIWIALAGIVSACRARSGPRIPHRSTHPQRDVVPRRRHHGKRARGSGLAHATDGSRDRRRWACSAVATRASPARITGHDSPPTRPTWRHRGRRVTIAARIHARRRGPLPVATSTVLPLHRQRGRGDAGPRAAGDGASTAQSGAGAEVVDPRMATLATLDVLASPQVAPTTSAGPHRGRRGDAEARLFATHVEPLPRILTDGLEQPVAHPAVMSSTTTSDLSTS